MVGGFPLLTRPCSCSVYASFLQCQERKGWGGGGGARAGGKQSSVLIDFFVGIFVANVSNLAEFFNNRTLCLSSGREQEERGGDSNAKRAQT